jgi:SAM-dependent methyltransferase
MVSVPLRNEFGLSYPAEAKDVVHKLFGLSDSDRVVDVGGGHAPLKRADIVVDLYPEATPHRGGALKLYEHQEFVQASVEDMTDIFTDKSVDFLFTSHMLEHTNDPAAACQEIIRVAKRGFIDVPRIIWDFHIGQDEHKWFIDYVDDVLVFRKKPIVNNGSPLFGVYAINSFWFDRYTGLMSQYYYRNVSSVQLLWEDTFAYKVIDWQ